MSLLAHIGRSGAKRLAPASARVLAKTEQLRQFAATPAHAEEDSVLASFRQSQQQYMQLMKGLESIKLPLTGDDAAIKKYAADVEALKKKIGMPDVEDVISAELDYKFACTGFDVKAFVVEALDSMRLDGNLSAARADLLAAVEEAEKAGGGALDSGNEKGWQVLTAKVGEIERKYGLQDKAKVRDEAIFEMYKQHIATLRTQVLDDTDKGRTEDVMDIPADLANLQPKLA